MYNRIVSFVLHCTLINFIKNIICHIAFCNPVSTVGDSSRSVTVLDVNGQYNNSYMAGAYPGFGRGGGARNFFFRFGNLHVAKRHAAHGEAMRIARGVRGHAPPRKFFKTVQFGAF